MKKNRGRKSRNTAPLMWVYCINGSKNLSANRKSLLNRLGKLKRTLYCMIQQQFVKFFFCCKIRVTEDYTVGRQTVCCGIKIKTKKNQDS